MSGAQYEATSAKSGEVIHGAVVAVMDNPFAKHTAKHIAAGTVAIESERAIAEAQGKLVIAKRFPRDEGLAFSRAMDACRRPSLAAVANYAFPRGGQNVSGPSIRLAEELARCWGNIDYGLRELSRRDGESEMEAFAWDLETNVMSSQKFTARHIRDKKGGGQALSDERDIYELTANLGARRLRARILAILPPDLVDAAVDMCRKTMAGTNQKPLADQIRDATQAFTKFGVTGDMIAHRLGHALDDTTPDELVDLREIYASLKDGMSKMSDWFGAKAEETPPKPASKLDALEQLAAAPSPELSAVLTEIAACATPNALTMLDGNAAFRARLKKLSDKDREMVRQTATARMEELGRPTADLPSQDDAA